MIDDISGWHEYALSELRAISMANSPSEHVLISISLNKILPDPKNVVGFLTKWNVVVMADEKLVLLGRVYTGGL